MLIPRAAELLLIVYTDKGGDGSVWIYADSRGAYSVVVVADDDDEQKSIMRVNNEDEKHSGLSVVDARISRECFLDDSATFQELPRREQSCKHDAIAAQTASKYTERETSKLSVSLRFSVFSSGVVRSAKNRGILGRCSLSSLWFFSFSFRVRISRNFHRRGAKRRLIPSIKWRFRAIFARFGGEIRVNECRVMETGTGTGTVGITGRNNKLELRWGDG